MVSRSCCLVHLPIAKWFSPVSPQPANCQGWSPAAPTPAVEAVLPPGCSLLCLKRWFLKCAKAQVDPRERPPPPLPLHCVYGRMCWHSTTFLLVSRVGGRLWCNFPCSLSLFMTFACRNQQPLQACHCRRKVRWDQKGARNAVSFLPQDRMVGINSNWEKKN